VAKRCEDDEAMTLRLAAVARARAVDWLHPARDGALGG
jgi:hypothetical protein